MSKSCRNEWTHLCYLCVPSDQNGFWVPREDPEHILLAFKDFIKVARFSVFLFPFVIYLLVNTVWAFCHHCAVSQVPHACTGMSLGLPAPCTQLMSGCSTSAGWIEEWPHHFWIWKPSLKQEYANHNPGHMLRSCCGERRRIAACCPVRRGTYPSLSSSPFFDTKI